MRLEQILPEWLMSLQSKIRRSVELFCNGELQGQLD